MRCQLPLDDLSDIDWVMVYNVVEAKTANASIDSCPRPTVVALSNEGDQHSHEYQVTNA